MKTHREKSEWMVPSVALAETKRVAPDVIAASEEAREATTGLRYDAGKNRVDLIPPEWIWGLATVMTQVAKK